MEDKFPTKSCDLIMKGGITSGVVYPKAITTIAEHYRLKGIGGASAGAIGAVVAAAAEYRRQEAVVAGKDETERNAGFIAIENIPLDLGENLQAMFQPSKPLAPVFDIFRAAIDANVNTKGDAHKKLRAWIAAARQFFRNYWLVFLVCWAVVALFFFTLMSVETVQSGALGLFGYVQSLAWAIAILTVGIGLPLLIGILHLGWIVLFRLPHHHFGLCTGKTQNSGPVPGFSDWMHLKIQEVAGRRAGDAPLLIRDLDEHDINIATITTDISSGRPYEMPIKTSVFQFCEEEFRKIFPDDVVDHMIRGQSPDFPPNEYGLKTFYRLPVWHDFPVLLMARMSLSFPGLICAVPLYRLDDTLAKQPDGSDKPPLKRCLFSDGGISSNFPIHFFDTIIPGHPTFGISLAEYKPEGRTAEEYPRVEMSEKRKTDSDLPVRDISGVVGFLMAIVNTAKDWQDTLQRLMPGYSERVVEVRLKSSEGGLNLGMSPETIGELTEFGAAAGQLVVSQFSFTEHRWKRVLTSVPEMGKALGALSRRFQGNLDPSYADLIRDYDGESSTDLSKTWRRETLLPLVEGMAKLGEERNLSPEGLPHINADFRLIASADREPRVKPGSGGGADG